MALKNCKECGNEVSSNGICQKCGKDQRNFFMKHKVLSFILIIFIIGVISLASGDNNNNTTTNNSATESNTGTNQQTNPTEKFTVLEHTTENDGYWTYVTGTIKNNTNKEYTYVQVEINLYDESGNLINSTLDNINNLEANGTWKFKAMATSEFSTYKIKEVTGW